MKTRTLVIGDIHGAYRALVQALARANATSQDKLIFLGDYVDGWSESRKVIEHLLMLNESNDCIFVRGNHDTWCEGWLKRGHADPTWLFHGGKSTIESYGNYEEATWKKQLNFFEAMRDYYVDENNNLFIHAGFSSMHGPEKEVYASNYSWDRTLWEMAITVDSRIKKDSPLYPKRLTLYNEIFIGHTSTINYGVDMPMNGANLWNVDTGAGFSGKVTVMEVHTKEFWQSDVVRTLYPGEKGRNND